MSFRMNLPLSAMKERRSWLAGLHERSKRETFQVRGSPIPWHSICRCWLRSWRCSRVAMIRRRCSTSHRLGDGQLAAVRTALQDFFDRGQTALQNRIANVRDTAVRSSWEGTLSQGLRLGILEEVSGDLSCRVEDTFGSLAPTI